MEQLPQTATPVQSAHALKHGLEATDDLLIRNLRLDEKDAFSDFRAIMTEQYKPADNVEILLVEKIAILNFRLFRLYKLELLAGSESYNSPLGPDSIMHHLDRISRYDSRIFHQLTLLQQTLARIQRQRSK